MRNYVAPGCKTMVTANLATSYGVTNGAECKVVSVAFKAGAVPGRDRPSIVFVRFPGREDLGWLDAARAAGLLRSPVYDELRGCVPIPVHSGYDDESGETIQGVPLRLFYACTIHKVQGASREKLVVTLPDKEDASTMGLTLVALTRCFSADGLIVSDFAVSRLVVEANRVYGPGSKQFTLNQELKVRSDAVLRRAVELGIVALDGLFDEGDAVPAAGAVPRGRRGSAGDAPGVAGVGARARAAERGHVGAAADASAPGVAGVRAPARRARRGSVPTVPAASAAAGAAVSIAGELAGAFSSVDFAAWYGAQLHVFPPTSLSRTLSWLYCALICAALDGPVFPYVELALAAGYAFPGLAGAQHHLVAEWPRWVDAFREGVAGVDPRPVPRDLHWTDAVQNRIATEVFEARDGALVFASIGEFARSLGVVPLFAFD
jgi:hypothetical protein